MFYIIHVMFYIMFYIILFREDTVEPEAFIDIDILMAKQGHCFLRK